MNKSRFYTALGGLILVPSAGFAQEALRTSVSANAVLDRPAPVAPGSDRLHWGPVDLSLGASLSIAYDSNFRNQPHGQYLSDVIITPAIDVGGAWAVNENSSLSLGVGIGYRFYLDNSEYDYLDLTPTSALAYTIQMGDVTLSLYDQFRYTADPIDTPEVTGVASYARMENTAGLQSSYLVGDWLVQGGYAHFNYWSFDERYDDLTRASEQLYARGGYLIGAETQAGLEGSVSFTRYDQPIRNNYDSYSVGPYVDWAATESLDLSVRGGYVLYAYDDSGIVPSPGDQDSYYLGLDVAHQLTDYITQTLAATHGLDVGTTSQTITRTFVGYGIRWQMTEVWDVGVGASWDRGDEPDFPGNEDYNRVGPSAGVGCQLTERFRLGLAYRYYTYLSTNESLDYNRNVVTLVGAYRF